MDERQFSRWAYNRQAGYSVKLAIFTGGYSDGEQPVVDVAQIPERESFPKRSKSPDRDSLGILALPANRTLPPLVKNLRESDHIGPWES